MTPLLDPRRHRQPRPGAVQAAPEAPPFRIPPGGIGHANGGVMVVVLPHATIGHLLDMANTLAALSEHRRTP